LSSSIDSYYITALLLFNIEQVIVQTVKFKVITIQLTQIKRCPGWFVLIVLPAITINLNMHTWKGKYTQQHFLKTTVTVLKYSTLCL